ncbi:MAG TPA: hypothetical protein VIT23_10010 [Terrimicrobiaceae bacterium]
MIASDCATPWYRILLHTPLTSLIVFVVVSLILRENYPFSHFPMYSSPSAKRYYFMVTDAAGQALPIASVSGITPPKIGKIHFKKSQTYEAKARKADPQGMPGQEETIGREICDMLREQAVKRGQTLAQGLQLYRVEIQYVDGQIKETRRLLFAE